MSVSTDDEDGNDIPFFDGMCDVIGLTPFENWQDSDRPISPSDNRFSQPTRHRAARPPRKGGRVESGASTLTTCLTTSSSVSHPSEVFSDLKDAIGCTVPTLKTAATKLRKLSFDPPVRCSVPSLSTRDVVGPLVACSRRGDATEQFRLDQLQRQRIRELEQVNMALKLRVDELEERDTGSGKVSGSSSTSESPVDQALPTLGFKTSARDVVEASAGPISQIVMTKEAKSKTERASASSAAQKKDRKWMDELMQEMEDLKKIVGSQRYVKDQLDSLRVRYRDTQAKNRWLEAERVILGSSLKSLNSKHSRLQRKLFITEQRHKTEVKLTDMIDRDNVTKAVILDLKYELHNLKCEVATERIMKRRYQHELEASTRALQGQSRDVSRATDRQPMLLSEQVFVESLRNEAARLRAEQITVALKFQANANAVAKHYWKEEASLRDETEALENQFVEIARGVASGSPSALDDLAAMEKRLTSIGTEEGSGSVDFDISASTKDCEAEDSDDELSMGPLLDPNANVKSVDDEQSGRHSHEDKSSDRSCRSDRQIESSTSEGVSSIYKIFDTPATLSLMYESGGDRALESEPLPCVPTLSEIAAELPLSDELPNVIPIVQSLSSESTEAGIPDRPDGEVKQAPSLGETLCDDEVGTAVDSPDTLPIMHESGGDKSTSYPTERAIWTDTLQTVPIISATEAESSVSDEQPSGDNTPLSTDSKSVELGGSREGEPASYHVGPDTDVASFQEETSGLGDPDDHASVTDRQMLLCNKEEETIGGGVPEDSAPATDHQMRLCDNTYTICAVIEVEDGAGRGDEELIDDTLHDYNSASSPPPYVGDVDGICVNVKEDNDMRDFMGSGDNSKTEASPPLVFENFPASPHTSVDVASNDWASDSILSEGSASIDMKSDTDLPRFGSVSDCGAALKLLSAAANSFLCSPDVEAYLLPTLSNDDATVEDVPPTTPSNCVALVELTDDVHVGNGIPSNLCNDDASIGIDPFSTPSNDDAPIGNASPSTLISSDAKVQDHHSAITSIDDAPIGREERLASLTGTAVPQRSVEYDLSPTTPNAAKLPAPCEETFKRRNQLDEQTGHNGSLATAESTFRARERTAAQADAESSNMKDATEKQDDSIKVSRRDGTIQNERGDLSLYNDSKSNEAEQQRLEECSESHHTNDFASSYGQEQADDYDLYLECHEFTERTGNNANEGRSHVDVVVKRFVVHSDNFVEDDKPIDKSFQWNRQSTGKEMRGDELQRTTSDGGGIFVLHHGAVAVQSDRVESTTNATTTAGIAQTDKTTSRGSWTAGLVADAQEKSNIRLTNTSTMEGEGGTTQFVMMDGQTGDAASLNHGQKEDLVGVDNSTNRAPTSADSSDKTQVDSEQQPLFDFAPLDAATSITPENVDKQASSPMSPDFSAIRSTPAIGTTYSSDSDLIRLDSPLETSFRPPSSHAVNWDKGRQEESRSGDIFWEFPFNSSVEPTSSESVDLFSTFSPHEGPSSNQFGLDKGVRTEPLYKPLPSFFKSTSADPFDFFSAPMNTLWIPTPESNVRLDATTSPINVQQQVDETSDCYMPILSPEVSFNLASEKLSSEEQRRVGEMADCDKGDINAPKERTKFELDNDTCDSPSECKLSVDDNHGPSSDNHAPSLEEKTRGENPSDDVDVPPLCGELAVRVTVHQQQPSNDDAAAAVTWFADKDGKRDDASEIESVDEWHSITDGKRTSVSDSEIESTDWHASIDGRRRTSVSGSEIESTGWPSSGDGRHSISSETEESAYYWHSTKDQECVDCSVLSFNRLQDLQEEQEEDESSHAAESAAGDDTGDETSTTTQTASHATSLATGPASTRPPVPYQEKTWLGDVVQGIASMWL